MQPCRSDAVKVDQFLITCWRALSSEFMQISRSLAPLVRLTVTAAAFVQVARMSMVGMYCAWAVPAKPPTKPMIATAAAMIEQKRGRIAARYADETKAMPIRASLG